MLSPKVLLYLFTIMFTARTASAIFCFQCNSANNSACTDLGKIPPEMRTNIIPVVNCDSDVPSAAAGPFFCRKIFQTIFHADRESEVRVTRGCGWVRDDYQRDCYSANNQDHLETVCQCFHNACNAGYLVRPGLVLVIGLLLGMGAGLRL